jgi:hypothetical protein
VSYATARQRGANGEINKLYPEDRPVHEWYRFVLSFPPHLVRTYLERFGIDERHRVLDPFCGTGTVLAECKKHGIPSVGIEANPMAHFASQVKVDWTPDPDGLIEHARHVAQVASARLAVDGIEDVTLFEGMVNGHHELRTLPEESANLLLTDSISPLPLHKALVLLECLERHPDGRYERHERLALAKALVYASSNLHFGPEVGVGPAKPDAPVISPWLGNVQGMANDLREVQDRRGAPAEARHADAREIVRVLAPKSVDFVFTSPPYPNEKDYTRTTRLETVLLGFIRDKADLQALKRSLLRSNTRNVYKGDDDAWHVRAHPGIQRIADAIEARRIELGKTSGFERLYATVTRLYFGGMARHLAELRTILRPGAHLAYVVGDQASYLHIFIPTGQLLAEIGQMLGYELVGIDLFRTRLATATGAQLREEVVVLRWPKDDNGDRYQLLPLGSDDGRIRSRQLMAAQKTNYYQQMMERIFVRHYQPGAVEISFEREELATTAEELGIDVPLNLGDIPYSFRYRQQLPQSIRGTAPAGKEWVIRSVGRSRFQIVLREMMSLVPSKNLVETKVPDATPGLVSMYAQDHEQGLLAKLRYNRLIDIFTGITCYSLQNHLRTTVPNIGQVETDELYVGVDRRGAHYVFPVRAIGGTDRLGIVQIEQDFALCEDRFPGLICRPVAAQFMDTDLIALFAFEKRDDVAKIITETHYRLVPPERLSPAELNVYSQRPLEE